MSTEAIQNIAAQALEEKRVDRILGFMPGTTPLDTQAVLVQDVPAVKKLVWNDFCVIDLTKKLLKLDKKTGIIANGCTSRNIVLYIMENQIRREDIYIIGVPCQGMLDRHKIKVLLGKKRIKKVKGEADQVILSGKTFTSQYPRRALLRQNCLYCRHRNPVLYDILAGEPVEENGGIIDPEIEALEAKSSQERFKYFHSIFSHCTLCYACRNACPLCYCPSCFVDRGGFQRSGKKAVPADIFTFHLFRIMHSAGRCTDCGACESACPMGLPLTRLSRKLNQDIQSLYNFEAGLNVETPLPLSVYNLEDRPDFILTEGLRKTSLIIS